MTRVRAVLALTGLVLLARLPLACRRAAPIKEKPHVVVVAADTIATTILKDTALAEQPSSRGRTFDLRVRAQRDSLRAELKRERALWRARSPRDYRFLLRVSCFCPGQRGWLLMEVRRGQPLQAWDTNGKAVPLSDWNTFSIDGLFDNLERSVDRNARVQITFDPRWHFPASVHTVVLPGPDAWGSVEVSGFRPSRGSQ